MTGDRAAHAAVDQIRCRACPVCVRVCERVCIYWSVLPPRSTSKRRRLPTRLLFLALLLPLLNRLKRTLRRQPETDLLSLLCPTS